MVAGIAFTGAVTEYMAVAEGIVYRITGGVSTLLCKPGGDRLGEGLLGQLRARS
jgi:hypothetical protein